MIALSEDKQQKKVIELKERPIFNTCNLKNREGIIQKKMSSVGPVEWFLRQRGEEEEEEEEEAQKEEGKRIMQ